jgi:hypothetical protein
MNDRFGFCGRFGGRQGVAGRTRPGAASLRVLAPVSRESGSGHRPDAGEVVGA